MTSVSPATPEKSTPVFSTGKVVAIVGLVVAGFFVFGSLFQTNLLPVDSVAPSFALTQANGRETVSNADLRGEVVLVDFWAISCPPCLREIEILKRLQTTYRSQRVSVVGISVGGESPSEIGELAKDRDVNYRLLIDSDGIVSQNYRVEVLPTMYIIDRNGKIAASHSGFWPADELEATLKSILENNR